MVYCLIMKNNYSSNNILARRIAFCSIMAALGTVIMLTGGLIPVFTYCSPLIAALLLVPVSQEYGKGYAWMVWLVTGILSLLIGIDKEASFFYLFLGYYPIVRSDLNRISSRLFRFAAKTVLFSAAVCGMYWLICYVFRIDDIINSFSASRIVNVAVLLAIVLCMHLYDRALVNLTGYYNSVLRPRLNRTGKKL